MKEFKKWYDSACEPHSSHLVGPANAWRAALEEIYSKLWLASGQVADEAKAWIRKELEG